jgi:4-diphosphocytidyl-2-C-methyl-D-erythritol kinase
MTAAPVRREAFAAAKVNLFLHVGPKAADGYHPIASLFVFADVGDRLLLDEGAARGLSIDGPFGTGLSTGPDNLVLRARDALSPDLAVRLKLEKALPLAAGLGGGSADAAATLRLLNPLLPRPRAPGEIVAIAAALGADVAACLESRAVMAMGRGDELSPAPTLPVLPAVLVNPGVESPTGAVYRAFDETASAPSADRPAMAAALATPREVADLVARTRNDLEAPAVDLSPAIGEALAALHGAPEALVARMSGSGATCFALCETMAEAGALAERLAAAHPRWWVRACRLGGPWT